MLKEAFHTLETLCSKECFTSSNYPLIVLKGQGILAMNIVCSKKGYVPDAPYRNCTLNKRGPAHFSEKRSKKAGAPRLEPFASSAENCTFFTGCLCFQGRSHLQNEQMFFKSRPSFYMPMHTEL